MFRLSVAANALFPMIIKSMSRKAPTFAQLITYIGRDADPHIGTTFARNLYHNGQDEQVVAGQFLDNYRYLPKRKNGNALYHEVIVLEPQLHLSKAEVTAALHELAERYCEARAPHQLAWGRVHWDTDYPHMHLMISANAVRSPLRVRLDKSGFARVQRDLETFKEVQFPELNGGVIYRRAKENTRPRVTAKEGEMVRRTGAPSGKIAVFELLRPVFGKAASLDALKGDLNSFGFDLLPTWENHWRAEPANRPALSLVYTWFGNGLSAQQRNRMLPWAAPFVGVAGWPKEARAQGGLPKNGMDSVLSSLGEWALKAWDAVDMVNNFDWSHPAFGVATGGMIIATQSIGIWQRRKLAQTLHAYDADIQPDLFPDTVPIEEEPKKWSWQVDAASRQGQVRKENQDAYSILEFGADLKVLLVFDGAGGIEGGGEVARSAVKTVETYLKEVWDESGTLSKYNLETAIEKARLKSMPTRNVVILPVCICRV